MSLFQYRQFKREGHSLTTQVVVAVGLVFGIHGKHHMSALCLFEVLQVTCLPSGILGWQHCKMLSLGTPATGSCFTKNLTTNRNRISYISTLSYAYDLS